MATQVAVDRVASVGFAQEPSAESVRPRRGPSLPDANNAALAATSAPPRPRAEGYLKDPMSVAPSELVPYDIQRHDRVGIRYQSAAHREASLERRAILLGLASYRFEPPPPPPGAGKQWDPEALRLREKFITEKAELGRTFTAQNTARAWARIEERLKRSQSALEAVHILEEMRVFLTTDPYITRIDVDASREMLLHVKLPFERLVRNVWVEGPEVQYDRSKQHVCALLKAESDARAELKAVGWKQVEFGPKREVSQLVHNLDLQARALRAAQTARREAMRPKFKGMKVERPRMTSTQANQRALLASFRQG